MAAGYKKSLPMEGSGAAGAGAGTGAAGSVVRQGATAHQGGRTGSDSDPGRGHPGDRLRTRKLRVRGRRGKAPGPSSQHARPGAPKRPVARPIRRVILPYANGNDPPVHPLMPRRPPTDPAARERLYQTRALGGLAASVLVVLAAFRLWPAAPGPTLADFERVERPREQ